MILGFKILQIRLNNEFNLKFKMTKFTALVNEG